MTHPTMARRVRPVFTAPTVSRFLVAYLGVALVGPAGTRAHAQAQAPTLAASPPLTEAQAVERALANPNLAELRAGLVDEARAEGIARTRWDDPSFQYTREQLLTGGPLGEDYVSLSQTFDISGRRALHRKAASQRGEAAEHRAAISRADLASLTRHSYYQLLVAQQRHGVLVRWRGRVESQLASIGRREEAGDAAAYDRLRLQRELTRIDAFAEREDATVVFAWIRLHGLIEPDAEARSRTPPKLDGVLLPPTPATAVAERGRAPAAPEFRLAEAQARALAFERRAASRWWVPTPFVGAGYKGVELPGGGRAHGFVVNLGIPLPLLDRGRAERIGKAGQARSLAAAANLARTRTRTEVDALDEQVTRLSAAAARMKTKNAEDDALVAAAESGYRGGEISVMELIDAYRSSAEAELLALDLAMTARAAEIDLRRRTEEAP